jgi:hypothetical protein
MKVAVLCPGPSLPRHWHGKGSAWWFDWVIAVNTAAWHYPCHWQHAHDDHSLDPILRGEYPRPTLGILTAYDKVDKVRGAGFLPVLGDRYAQFARPRFTRCGWSAPNAIAFALQAAGVMGQVCVYGMDFADSANDYCGQPGNDYGPHRWDAELGWLRAFWSPQIQLFSDMSSENRKRLTTPE